MAYVWERIPDSVRRITVTCKQCSRQWLWNRPYKKREYNLNPLACPDCCTAEIEELKKQIDSLTQQIVSLANQITSCTGKIEWLIPKPGEEMCATQN
jgi:hypothetical protein